MTPVVALMPVFSESNAIFSIHLDSASMAVTIPLQMELESNSGIGSLSMALALFMKASQDRRKAIQWCLWNRKPKSNTS